MTATQLTKLRDIERRIAVYERALEEALTSGTASASQGSSGASQSYTRLSPDQYRTEISRLRRERGRLLRGGARRRTSPDFA